jgi:OmpA-OmpF porin, OOP family
MTNRCLLGAGVALAVALGGVQAHAQLGNMFGPFPPGAFYLGPEGGWTSLASHEDHFHFTTASGASFGVNPKETFNSGFNVGVRAGYVWGPWRFEEEYSYRNNSTSSFFGAGNAIVNGNRHANAIMTNVLYDLTLGWPVTPHIGAGVGAVNIVDGVSSNLGRVPVQLSRVGINSFSLNGNTWEFGYQGIAGIRYMINPALALDIDYRYLATPDFTISGSGGVNGVTRRVSYKTGYSTQNVVASLTMMFGAPPPAAPPPAPPAPPPPPPHQVYLVFFDWDKYNITPEGEQILQAAADHYKSGAAVQIQVTGYTDLSGSAGYNQRLSERRANAVAVALEQLGVPRNEMIVTGRGMNDPRVPTPLGVREPQNRRVEIVFP